MRNRVALIMGCVLVLQQACTSDEEPDDSAGDGMAGNPDSGGGGKPNGSVGGGGGASGGSKPSGGSDTGGTGGQAAGGQATGGQPMGPAGGSRNPGPPLQECPMGGAENMGGAGGWGGATSGDYLLIDDFEDSTNGFTGGGLDGGWYSVADDTGGTLETHGFEPVEAGERGGSLNAVAEGFSRWGALVGAYLGEGCVFDASEFDGITFLARGSLGIGEEPLPLPLTVHAVELADVPVDQGGTCEEGCWTSRRAAVAVDECWQRYTLRFDDMQRPGSTTGELDSSSLYLLDFVMPPGVRTELWLDDVAFFRGEEPSQLPACD